MESLASFANAALYQKPRIAFYVNSYVYQQILLYRKTAGEDDEAFKFWKTYPFESMNWINPKFGMTQVDYMRKNGFLMLIGKTQNYKKRMDYFKYLNPILIYSMWDGYVNKDGDAYDPDWGRVYHSWDPDRLLTLHTSGHATSEDLRQMILTVKPRQAILPIHTEKPGRFKMLDIGEYADMVKSWEDKDVYELS